MTLNFFSDTCPRAIMSERNLLALTHKREGQHLEGSIRSINAYRDGIELWTSMLALSVKADCVRVAATVGDRSVRIVLNADSVVDMLSELWELHAKVHAQRLLKDQNANYVTSRWEFDADRYGRRLFPPEVVPAEIGCDIANRRFGKRAALKMGAEGETQSSDRAAGLGLGAPDEIPIFDPPRDSVARRDERPAFAVLHELRERRRADPLANAIARMVFPVSRPTREMPVGEPSDQSTNDVEPLEHWTRSLPRCAAKLRRSPQRAPQGVHPSQVRNARRRSGIVHGLRAPVRRNLDVGCCQSRPSRSSLVVIRLDGLASARAWIPSAAKLRRVDLRERRRINVDISYRAHQLRATVVRRHVLCQLLERWRLSEVGREGRVSANG